MLFALLAGGALGLPPGAVRAQESNGKVYETVVVAPPLAAEAPRADRAASASVITQDRTPRAAESVMQLLSEQAGASVTRLGGMGSTATVSLRGSTANQVLVYVDGVPYNTVTGGGVDVGAIPLGDVERIEIYRGMSPIAFGASAIGGVVSITTALPKDNRIGLEVGGGSFTTYYGNARAAWNRGRFHLYAGLHAFSSRGDFAFVNTMATTANPADDITVRRHSNDLFQIDGVVRAAVDLAGERRLTATASWFARDQGLPGYGLIAEPHARLGTLRVTGSLAYESMHDHGALGQVRALAYATCNRTHFRDLDGHIAAGSTDARDHTGTAGITLAMQRSLWPWLLLSGILDGRYDGFRPSDVRASGWPASRLFGAAGLESDFWIEPVRFDVIASLRVEAAREKTSGRDNFDALLPTSPPANHVLPIARLSFIKQLAAWLSVRANGGRYARLPSTIELYGNTGYLLGNPTLRPESGVNADFGPLVSRTGAASSLTWSTAGFASWVSDLIQYQMAGGRARARNIGSARILGVESSATLVLGRHLRLFASFTFTDARDTTTVPAYRDRQLALHPRYRAYARPEWRAVQLGKSVALGFYADLDATAGNYLDPSNSQQLPSRLLVGAGAYAELPAGLRLQASGRNLLDARVIDLAGYPLPGREFYLTLVWSPINHKPKEP